MFNSLPDSWSCFTTRVNSLATFVHSQRVCLLRVRGFYHITFNFLINNDFLKHKQAIIKVNSRRSGVIVTSFSRQSQ